MVSPFLFLGCDKLNESCDKQCLRHEFEDQAANCVCLGMFVECTNVLYHISDCILRYLIYDIMIISIILQESFPCLPGVLGNLYCFTTLIDSANQTKSLPKILGGSGPRPRFRIEMMGCFMSWVARPWNPNVLWAAGGHLCWSDEPGGLEWNPRSWGLNWWERCSGIQSLIFCLVALFCWFFRWVLFMYIDIYRLPYHITKMPIFQRASSCEVSAAHWIWLTWPGPLLVLVGMERCPHGEFFGRRFWTKAWNFQHKMGGLEAWGRRRPSFYGWVQLLQGNFKRDNNLGEVLFFKNLIPHSRKEKIERWAKHVRLPVDSGNAIEMCSQITWRFEDSLFRQYDTSQCSQKTTTHDENEKKTTTTHIKRVTTFSELVAWYFVACGRSDWEIPSSSNGSQRRRWKSHHSSPHRSSGTWHGAHMYINIWHSVYDYIRDFLRVQFWLKLESIVRSSLCEMLFSILKETDSIQFPQSHAACIGGFQPIV